MKCPACNGKTRIIQTQQIDYKVKRRRKCENCLVTFSTYETANLSLLEFTKLKAEAGENYAP